MLTRWLIRSFFIGLLTLCVAAWVGSYWRVLEVWHTGATVKGFCVVAGRIVSAQTSSAKALSRWKIGFSEPGPSPTWAGLESDPDTEFHFLGFVYHKTSRLDFVCVTIPLWFLSLLSAGLLWLAWRMTRLKPPGRAFPVEPAKSGDFRQ